MSDCIIITCEEARELIATKPVAILDLRDYRSFRAGHIEGARLLHEGLEQTLIEQSELDKPLLLYCFRGVTSKEKAAHFCRLGFRFVYTLEGGFTAWPRTAPSPFQRSES